LFEFLQISELQEEIQHLHNEIEALRSGTGPMESLDKSDVGQPTALMLKREIQRLTEELLRSDYGNTQQDNGERERKSLTLFYFLLQLAMTIAIVAMFWSKSWKRCVCARTNCKARQNKHAA